LTVLRDALTRAVSGAGGVLVIRGDPGIGKSTLIGAALDAVHVTGFVGHAVPGGSRPGRAVAEIAVAALAAGAGAGLDDPAVALFRRPLAALIGSTVNSSRVSNGTGPVSEAPALIASAATASLSRNDAMTRPRAGRAGCSGLPSRRRNASRWRSGIRFAR